jgi:hypothetical protein
MANLSYDLGKRTLGLSRNQFSSALSMLTLELVTVRMAVEVKLMTGANFSTNQYWLRGSRRDPFNPDHADRATNDPETLDEASEVDDDFDFDFEV